MLRPKKRFAGRVLFLLPVLCSMLFAAVISHNNAKAASDDWTSYINSSQDGYNAAETTLNSANVGTLALKWSHTSGAISAQPIVSNGVVYWGSWDGFEQAYTTSGTKLWATQLGQTSDAGCNPSSIGVSSTATVGTAGSTPAIFVGGGGNVNADGHDNLVALNATTGAVIWKTDIGTSPAPATYQFGSPVYSNGSVYIGIASLCDIPLVQGQLLKVNASTGQIQATFNVVPNGCIGGGIWSTPIITSDGKVYFSTATIGPCNQPEETAVVELNASDLSLVGYSHINAGNGDFDFGAVSIFSANGTNYVGALNKNGIFYAFRQNNLSAGVVWQTTIAASNQCPQCGGNIAPAAFDGTRLYIASGSANGCAGTVSALNPATGAFEWRHCLNAPDLAAVTAFPGVVVVGAGNQISAVNASTGASLYTYTASGGPFWGPPTVAEGMLFEGNQSGQLLAFAPASGGPTPTPTSGSGSYEAESSANTLAGSAVVAACSACSGGAKVGYVGLGGTLKFNNVQASSAGTVTVTIYYVDGDAGRTAQMSVNGGAATTVTFHGTNDVNWNFVQSMTVSVPLNAGNNTILFSNAAASAPDFDRITVASTSAPTPTPTPNPSSGYYEIVNRNSGQVLDVTGNSTSNGGLVVQWTYHAGTNQQWQEVSVNGGYKLINRNSGLLLDNPNSSKTNGTQLDQWSDTNTSNQWWNLVSAGGGYYYIVNQSSGLYADVAGSSTTAGASVVEWPSNGGTNQQWQLIPV